MSCSSCHHWWWDRRWRSEHYGHHGPEQAYCTLNPQWIETKAEHFCSHEASFNLPNTVADKEDERMKLNFYALEDRDQKARAIEAEKKLKEVRKKLREARARK